MLFGKKKVEPSNATEKMEELLKLSYQISESADNGAHNSGVCLQYNERVLDLLESCLKQGAKNLQLVELLTLPVESHLSSFSRIITQIFETLALLRADSLQNKTSFSYLGERIGLVRTRYGVSIFVDTTDQAVSPYLISQGTYKDHIITIINKCLYAGDVFIDIGQNAGFFAAVAAKRVGHHGNVFFHDPVSRKDLINRSLDLNDVLLQTKRISSLLDRPRLDEALPDISEARMLRIDFQSVEVSVLDGMDRVLEKSPKIIVLIEHKGCPNDATHILNLLSERGFRIYQMQGSDKWEVCDLTDLGKGTIGDLLCYREPIATLHLDSP